MYSVQSNRSQVLSETLPAITFWPSYILVALYYCTTGYVAYTLYTLNFAFSL
jgi:hypothetical protein